MSQPCAQLSYSAWSFDSRKSKLQPLARVVPYLFIICLFFLGLGHRELYSSHEARAAQIAQRMLNTGEWGLPTLFDNRADYQKPPGFYWAVAAVGWLNGGIVTEWVARFPAAIAGLLCVLMVSAILRSEGRPQAAFIAALVLATANHFTSISRTARIDVPLACAVTASLLAVYRGFSHYPLVWFPLAALATGMAVLLKGPVAVALIGPAVVIWFIIERRHRPISLPIGPLLLVPLIVAGIALPWFIWVNFATDGEYLRVFIWHHNVARFTGSSPLLATHPWWYYAPRFALDFLPWTPPLIGLVVWGIRNGSWKTDPTFRFSLIACVTIVAILSTAKFKRADYLIPAYPFAAIAFGCVAEHWLASKKNLPSARRAVWGFFGLVGIGVIIWLVTVLVIERQHQAREGKKAFAEVIRMHAPQPIQITQFRMESHLLSFHLGHPLRMLVEWGDLSEVLAQPGQHFVVMPTEFVFATSQIIPSRKLIPIAETPVLPHDKPYRRLVFLRTED